jgi:ribosomal protein L29
MKVKELRTKTNAELAELLRQASHKIAQSQFYHSRSRSKNVKEVRELRRQRARILTLLKEKKI